MNSHMTPPLRLPRFSLAAIVLLASAIGADEAHAQTEEELVQAFSGDWIVVDSKFTTDSSPCRIRLEEASSIDPGWRQSDIGANCAASILPRSLWRIEEGKILLRSPDGEPLAELGGEPTRLTGDFFGDPDAIILEREAGSGAKADLVKAISRHRCYFLGYTDTCAQSTATQAPDLAEGPSSIDVLVDLNVRSQPRREAATIGAVPAGSEVMVNLCFSTSDGIWCRAQFGEQSGWMAKSAIRQGEWPVLTFVNSSES